MTISKAGVGTILISGGSYGVHSLNDTTASLSIASGASLSLAAIAQTSTFGQSLTVQSGGTLTVGAGAGVTIGENVTLTDNGTLSFASGDTVSLIASGSGPTEIVVGSGGLLTASATAFSTNVSGYGYLVVTGGGHLTASNSTFASALNQVDLNNGSILNAGDLVGNSFNCPLYLPEGDVQYLSGSGSNNAQFQDIDILSGTEASGQTLALNAIGTASTANLLYVFTGNFTVTSGATLNVGANVSVQVGGTDTLTDNGTLSFASGDTVSLIASGSGATQIVVGNGGVLTASSTAFSSNVSGYGYIIVNGGGHLTASNSTFASALIQVDLNNGSILNAGDLVGNSFNCPLYLPEGDVQYLSGSGSNNAQFQTIDILGGSVPTGQTLTLNAIGTASTANLLYVFTGNFTVASGATLNVGANVSVQVGATDTLTDDGTVTFASGDTVTLIASNAGATEIVVGNGGLLTASSTVFSSNVGGYGYLVVTGGGHLTASNSTFASALNQVDLNSGSILNAGDLTGNSFNCPLYLPEGDVQYLSGTGSNNAQFQTIDILSGTEASGPTLALNAIGTASTANLLYVFTGNFTVASGATLNVGANVNVQVGATDTLTDDGTVTFASGDTVTLIASNAGATEIVVGNGGLLTASSTAFSTNVSGYGYIIVNGGGHLTASNSTFALNNVSLTAGSTDTIQVSSFATQLAINSGASINIASNDFTNIGTNGLIATGDPNATINLVNNYWGTTVAVNIAAKILDHVKDATRPTVLYTPYLSAQPTAIVAANASVLFSTAVQNVNLSASVTGTLGALNVGTVTFTLLNGGTVVGNPDSANVVNGLATTPYAIPAGLLGGTYTIQAAYSGTTNFNSSSDNSHQLTVSAAASTTVAANASTVFDTASQNVALSATVTSPAGTVNEGTETFTILNGTVVIGTPVTVNVSSGAAAANYILPAGIEGGTYTIVATYNGTIDFFTDTDSSHSLVVNAAASATSAANASATFRESDRGIIPGFPEPARGGVGRIPGSRSRADSDMRRASCSRTRKPITHCFVLLHVV